MAASAFGVISKKALLRPNYSHGKKITLMFSSKNFVALAPKMRSGTHTEVTFEAGVGKSPSFVVGRGRVDLSYFPHWPALSFLSKSADLRRYGPDPQTRPPATPAAPTSLDRRGCAVGSRIGSRQCPGGSCFFETVDKARSRLFGPPRFHMDLGTSLPALRSEAAGRSLGAAPGGDAPLRLLRSRTVSVHHCASSQARM